MRSIFLRLLTIPLAISLAASGSAQKRLVLIDQDGSGPGGSNQMAMMALLLSPQIQVLGITMVTGNAWRDEETQHTLRMLELIQRTDVPVAMGAVFPLVRSQEETRLTTPLIGQQAWLGAWGGGPTTFVNGNPAGQTPDHSVINPGYHGPYEVPALPEGAPTTHAIEEDAVHFLIRQVHAHPHQVTLYAAGPLTNIALAIRTDPDFAALTNGIVLMGGSLNPQTDDPEFAGNPRHEFNFWFDPEAAHIVLTTPWPGSQSNSAQHVYANSADSVVSPGSPSPVGIVVTTVDVSIKAKFTDAMLAEISKSSSPAAQYIAHFSQERYYLWDELAACALIDPSIITKERYVYLDVDINHGPEYGNTLTWTDQLRPAIPLQKAHAQLDVDLTKFQSEFIHLMTQLPPATAR